MKPYELVVRDYLPKINNDFIEIKTQSDIVSVVTRWCYWLVGVIGFSVLRHPFLL